ncbi:MAG: methionyl-tRNA formyltransferase [Flavobacteriales bacterium]
MKIICFGTPSFTSEIIKNIERCNDIVCIVTTEDTQKGRGKKMLPSDVKKTAFELNIPILQPNKLDDKEFIEKLEEYNADLFLVIAFRKLPKVVWELPKKGTINLHTSLLPEYRGAAPINWVLINGENKTGVTTFFINEKIDQGDIILQKKINLDQNITAGQLHNLMINDGIEIVNKTINLIDENDVQLIYQSKKDEFKAAPKLNKELQKINWQKSIIEIHNKIRGLSPFIDQTTMLKDVSICPCAWFFLNSKRVKIQKSSVVEIVNKVRYLDTDNKNYLNVNFKNKALSLEIIQPEGKKPMNIKQFLQGNKIESSDIIK